MPRKSCCCNVPPPPISSCCRPIYNGCVGKKYEFTFLIKIIYPCWKNFAFTQNEFTCPNNSSIVYPIQNDYETFRVTVNYTITEPAYQNRPFQLNNVTWQNNFYSPMLRRCEDIEPGQPVINCGDADGSPASVVVAAFYSGVGGKGIYPGHLCGSRSWPCASTTFSAADYTTWPPLPQPGVGYGCDCFNGKYAKCNFSEVRSCTDACDDGYLAGIYKCGLETFFNAPGQTPECPPDAFGNPQTPVIIEEPVDPDYFWPNCYHSWLLQKPNLGFVSNDPSYCAITDYGEVDMSNIADSYTIQFVPDPNVPEQNNPNYTPKIQPRLIHFWVGCNKNGLLEGFAGDYLNIYGLQNNNDAYAIGLKMGFGYRAEFCCDSGVGTGPNPNNPEDCKNIEVVDIPYVEFVKEDFFGRIRNTQGPTVNMLYGRASLPNDPMNFCVPTSSSNNTNLVCVPNTCETGPAYYDEYNACFKGKPDVRFFVSDPQETTNTNVWVYNNYCADTGWDESVDWPLCNHVKIDYKIDVRRLI